MIHHLTKLTNPTMEHIFGMTTILCASQPSPSNHRTVLQNCQEAATVLSTTTCTYTTVMYLIKVTQYLQKNR